MVDDHVPRPCRDVRRARFHHDGRRAHGDLQPETEGSMMDDILFSIRDLTVKYATRSGDVHAVDHVSFDILRGEILGLVGESGCGKSTLGKAIMRMIRTPGRIEGGELWFDGVDLITLSERQMQSVRGGDIGMVFQDPMTSLNPVQRVICLLYTSPSPRDGLLSRMPS